MKKFCVFILMVFSFSLCFASPFGLKKGMTLAEIEKECNGRVKYIENDMYQINPIKNHPLFETYFVYVNSKTGLYRIDASSKSIKTNSYGTELKESFYEITNRVSKTYGKPKIIDEVDAVLPYLSKDNFWFQTLRDGSRTLSAVWDNKKENLPDGLNEIKIYVKGEMLETGWVFLEYRFTNISSVEDDQDSVF